MNCSGLKEPPVQDKLIAKIRLGGILQSRLLILVYQYLKRIILQQKVNIETVRSFSQPVTKLCTTKFHRTTVIYTMHVSIQLSVVTKRFPSSAALRTRRILMAMLNMQRLQTVRPTPRNNPSWRRDRWAQTIHHAVQHSHLWANGHRRTTLQKAAYSWCEFYHGWWRSLQCSNFVDDDFTQNELKWGMMDDRNVQSLPAGKDLVWV